MTEKKEASLGRPEKTLTVEMIESVAFRCAAGQTLRQISKAVGLSEYIVKRIINHPDFEAVAATKRAAIEALHGGKM